MTIQFLNAVGVAGVVGVHVLVHVVLMVFNGVLDRQLFPQASFYVDV